MPEQSKAPGILQNRILEEQVYNKEATELLFQPKSTAKSFGGSNGVWTALTASEAEVLSSGATAVKISSIADKEDKWLRRNSDYTVTQNWRHLGRIPVASNSTSNFNGAINVYSRSNQNNTSVIVTIYIAIPNSIQNSSGSNPNPFNIDIRYTGMLADGMTLYYTQNGSNASTTSFDLWLYRALDSDVNKNSVYAAIVEVVKGSTGTISEADSSLAVPTLETAVKINNLGVGQSVDLSSRDTTANSLTAKTLGTCGYLPVSLLSGVSTNSYYSTQQWRHLGFININSNNNAITNFTGIFNLYSIPNNSDTSVAATLYVVIPCILNTFVVKAVATGLLGSVNDGLYYSLTDANDATASGTAVKKVHLWLKRTANSDVYSTHVEMSLGSQGRGNFVATTSIVPAITTPSDPILIPFVSSGNSLNRTIALTGGVTGSITDTGDNLSVTTTLRELTAADIPNLSMDKITTGNLPYSRLTGTPSIPAVVSGANLTQQAATFGQPARDGTLSTFARSDHYHALPSTPPAHTHDQSQITGGTSNQVLRGNSSNSAWLPITSASYGITDSVMSLTFDKNLTDFHYLPVLGDYFTTPGLASSGGYTSSGYISKESLKTALGLTGGGTSSNVITIPQGSNWSYVGQLSGDFNGIFNIRSASNSTPLSIIASVYVSIPATIDNPRNNWRFGYVGMAETTGELYYTRIGSSSTPANNQFDIWLRRVGGGTIYAAAAEKLAFSSGTLTRPDNPTTTPPDSNVPNNFTKIESLAGGGSGSVAWADITGKPTIPLDADLSSQASTAGQSARNGLATTFARSDHYHALPAAPAGTNQTADLTSTAAANSITSATIGVSGRLPFSSMVQTTPTSGSVGALIGVPAGAATTNVNLRKITLGTGLALGTDGVLTATASGSGGGTITGVTAGTGLSGGGTTGSVSLALSTPVTVANGGTGLSTFTGTNRLLLSGSSATTMTTLTASANANRALVTTAANGAPSWGYVSLSTLGTSATAALTGTASSSTYLRGDGAWGTPSGSAGTGWWGWNAASNMANISSVNGSQVGDYFVNTGTQPRTILGITAGIGDVVRSTSATAGTAAGNIRGTQGDPGASGSGGTSSIPRGYSTTPAATAAKTASISGFTRSVGSIVAVSFTEANSASTPTLNVESTGAANIRYNGVAPTTGMMPANFYGLFQYGPYILNGTNYWNLLNPATSGSASGNYVLKTGDTMSGALNIRMPSVSDTALLSLGTAGASHGGMEITQGNSGVQVSVRSGSALGGLKIMAGASEYADSLASKEPGSIAIRAVYGSKGLASACGGEIDIFADDSMDLLAGSSMTLCADEVRIHSTRADGVASRGHHDMVVFSEVPARVSEGSSTYIEFTDGSALASVSGKMRIRFTCESGYSGNAGVGIVFEKRLANGYWSPASYANGAFN